MLGEGAGVVGLNNTPATTSAATVFTLCIITCPAPTGLPYTPPASVGPDYLAAEAAALKPGQRCCVEPGERRGEIK